MEVQIVDFEDRDLGWWEKVALTGLKDVGVQCAILSGKITSDDPGIALLKEVDVFSLTTLKNVEDALINVLSYGKQDEAVRKMKREILQPYFNAYASGGVFSVISVLNERSE